MELDLNAKTSCNAASTAITATTTTGKDFIFRGLNIKYRYLSHIWSS